MRIGLYIRVAFENMGQNKLRTGLTLLGLIVGISSVLIMTGLGRGFQQVNDEMLASLLPNKMSLYPGYTSTGTQNPLTVRDAKLLASRVGNSSLLAVAPSLNLYNIDVRGFDPQNTFLQLTATTADFIQTERLSFLEGRFFTQEEEDNREQVVVINASFQSMLFNPDGSPATDVYIANKRFSIVGVIEENNFFGGMGYPIAYIPISLLPYPLYSENVQYAQGSPVVEEIDVLSIDIAHLEQAKREVEMLMRLAHGLTAIQENDFYINVESEFLNVVQDSSRIFTMVLGGIGGISLLVSGIGIMNIMLATITERTREIGIRKAIGARDFDILLQFLIEAIIICLVGAGLSIALSYSIASIVTNQMQSGDGGMGELRIVIDYQSVMIATLCGTAAGIIFGLYPAIRAMRLDPIQALQSE